MKITQSFKKFGWNFELVSSEYLGQHKESGRKSYKAIYKGSAKNIERLNVEVVILKEGLPNKMWGETENVLRYPGTEQWGRYGWTYPNMEMAEKKYNEIPSICD